MPYFVPDLFLTLRPPAPTMQPESSDGFASVGTILPEERAALLPGGSFRLSGLFDLVCRTGRFCLPGFRPLLPAGLTSPRIERIDPFKRGIAGAAAGAFWHFELGYCESRFLNDLFWNPIGSNCASLFELVSRNQHSRIQKFGTRVYEVLEGIAGTGLINPAVDPGELQVFRELLRLFH